ncbi:hypothetical protein [Salinibacillus xinjiangensis]|uniref:Uncharacterized protein n=1 Tax=Salinibacillus xinjiangensis TaxID=1229268 RepID=A0A6G1X6U0_9BACI|nr:hypothetical protein [Salinibacillus xinjiangensis]MRG86721.1 hypothetical protein [Salinibacillus xinjiangensis]
MKAYKDINNLIDSIEGRDIDEIKRELEIILTFPLGEAVFSLFDRVDVDTLKKSLTEYIKTKETTDPDQFLEYISLYLKRIGR